MHPGQSIELSVTARTYGPQYFTWLRDGVVLEGANTMVYSEKIDSKDTGSHTLQAVVQSFQNQTFKSDIFLVNVVEVPAVVSPLSGLNNLSIRASCGGSNGPLTLGFSSSGNSALPLLVRAAGPELTRFGIQGNLQDPVLSLFQAGKELCHNDGWALSGMLQNISALTIRVGAFAFTDILSHDCAMGVALAGPHTLQIQGAGAGSSGVVLVEAYDCAANAGARLVNLSAMNFVGSSGAELVLGFTVSGSKATKLLVRGVGPGLQPFGVSGVLARPRLELHGSAAGADTVLAVNQGWDGSASQSAIFDSVGAFALQKSSGDCALVSSLPAGNYTVILSGADGGNGVALIELYVLSE